MPRSSNPPGTSNPLYPSQPYMKFLYIQDSIDLGFDSSRFCERQWISTCIISFAHDIWEKFLPGPPLHSLVRPRNASQPPDCISLLLFTSHRRLSAKWQECVYEVRLIYTHTYMCSRRCSAERTRKRNRSKSKTKQGMEPSPGPPAREALTNAVGWFERGAAWLLHVLGWLGRFGMGAGWGRWTDRVVARVRGKVTGCFISEWVMAIYLASPDW